jgi:hypothetical protein
MRTRVDIRLLEFRKEILSEKSIIANLWCEIVVHCALPKIICDLGYGFSTLLACQLGISTHQQRHFVAHAQSHTIAQT